MIHTLTLNPAIDKILFFDRLDKNVTNRIRSTVDTIGGKGTHVSINLKVLGKESCAFGICHGHNGRRIMNMLESHGIHVHFHHFDSKETRTNYLLIEDNADCTIVAESGVLLDSMELEPLLAEMDQTIQREDYLIFSGDASNSPDPLIYNQILKRFKKRNLKIFLDTSGQSLKECVAESPYLIKPNLDELSTLTGHPIPHDDRRIIEAIHSLEHYGIEYIAVSLGGNGSITKTPAGFYRVLPPQVHVCNTIGCGDCFLAGFAYGVSEGFSIEEILGIATAASAATAESHLSAGFDLKRAQALKAHVTIEKLA